MNAFICLSTPITILLLPNRGSFISTGGIVKSIMGREEWWANRKQDKVYGEFTCASLNFTVDSFTFKNLQASVCRAEGSFNKQRANRPQRVEQSALIPGCSKLNQALKDNCKLTLSSNSAVR